MKTSWLQYIGVRQTDDTSRVSAATFRALRTQAMSNGVALDVDPTTGEVGYRFTAGQTRAIAHGLGSVYNGFLVTADFGATHSELVSVVGVQDTKTIVLTHLGAGACMVKLWVW